MRGIRNQAKWLANYEDVCAYLKRHRCVLSEIPEDALGRTGVKLARWLRDMRKACFDEGTLVLTDREKSLLQGIGIAEMLPPNEKIWWEHLEDLKLFCKSHGTFEIPSDVLCGDGKNLSEWVNLQRRKYRQGKLKPRFCDGFVRCGLMQVLETPLETALRHAEGYYRIHGDLDVPPEFVCEDGYRLGGWVRTARERAEKLPDDVRKMLDAMGMIWDKADRAWMQQFERCRTLYEDCGNIADKTLAGWLARQQKRFREGKLSEQQAELLRSIGAFDTVDKPARSQQNPPPDRRASRWMGRFKECRAFLDAHHRLPQRGEHPLYAWLCYNRKRSREGKLTAEQTSLLTELGAFAAPEKPEKPRGGKQWAQWVARCNECRAFFESYHRLPEWSDGSLYAWVQSNRRKMQAGTLSEEKIRLLNEIGITAQERRSVDEKYMEKWLAHYAECEAFFAVHHRLPKKGEGHLSEWIQYARRRYQAGKLTQEQIELLNRIGALDSRSAMLQKSTEGKRMQAWLSYFARCREIFEAQGDLSGLQIPELKEWLKRSRKKFREGNLTEEQIAMLQSIGVLGGDVPQDARGMWQETVEKE